MASTLTKPVERDKVWIVKFDDFYGAPQGGERGQVKRPGSYRDRFQAMLWALVPK